MTARECLQILREIKDVAFATADENGMPHNRIIDVMLVEDERLYFCTARGKDFYRQLMGTGYTEITGMNREYQMVRLAGRVQRLPPAVHLGGNTLCDQPGTLPALRTVL